MKEILDEESKNALINYRIQRAYETLKEAQVILSIMLLLIASIMHAITQRFPCY